MTASGFKKEDVIIDVEEKKPRVMDYGGGFSTDTGPLGLLGVQQREPDEQAASWSYAFACQHLQQLLRFEYVDPGSPATGERRFAPLAFSVEYQRDSTVTRFFRSTTDCGQMVSCNALMRTETG